MKKSRKPLFFALNLLITIGVLFSSVQQSYAQDDQGWSEPVNLSLSGTATNPLLVIDSQNMMHAIWLDTVDGYKYSQSADGVIWSQPQLVKFPFDKNGALPILLPDAKDLIHIFWVNSDADLYYAAATSRGLTNPSNWSVKIPLARGVVNYDVVADSQGILHIAYVHNVSSENNPAGVYYRQSTVGGGSWKAATRLYESEYLRSAGLHESLVSIATAKYSATEKIYVTWDNRPQKRVFLAISENAGLGWGEAKQIKGPQDTGGVDSPFNLSVAAVEDKVLLLWQVGKPGADKCSIFSQWSETGGESWRDPVAVFGGPTDCPTRTRFVAQDDDHMVVMLTGHSDPLLMAWNGDRWSEPQAPTRLPALSSPFTFDTILLGCRFDLIHQDQLYVVGCDQGGGGDVWFLSRSLEPLDTWFSPLSLWDAENILSRKSGNPKQIHDFSSVADESGNIHVIWAESSAANDGNSESLVQYALWDGRQLTVPQAIFGPLSGMPVQLFGMKDSLNRLSLMWVDNNDGELLFSWSSLDKANLPSEWASITGLPAPSQLISAPVSVSDGSGRIVTVYAVPINEGRGIYMVQFAGEEGNWSAPIQIFDAASAGWERIDHPRLSLGSDGVLHLIFVRQTVRVGQPAGLYYSHSIDGGVTWSSPQILSPAEIQWADIVSYGDKTVHVVWQEYNGLVFANVSQVSQDSGETWGKQNDVTGVSSEATSVALASDGHGLLHFIQLVKKAEHLTISQENFVLQDWEWDGNAWSPGLLSNVTIQGREVIYSLSASLTPAGLLSVFIPVEYTDPVTGINDEILMFSRYLEDASTDQASQIGIIPVPTVQALESDGANLQPTPTPGLTILDNKEESASSLQRTITGLALVGVGVIVSVIMFTRRRPSKKAK